MNHTIIPPISRSFRHSIGETLLLATAILGVAFPGTVLALDRYVAPPPLGFDTNPGTQALPYATINKAAAEALAGETVWIAPGTYQPTSPIQPARSGTESAPITYRAQPGGQVIIDGQTTVPVPSTRDGLIWVRNKSWIVIDGLRVINSGFSGIFMETSHHITVQNCSTFFTYASGIIAATNSTNIKVLNNSVQQACIMPSPTTGVNECITMASVDTFEVAYNTVFDRPVNTALGGEGIDAKNSCINGTIHHNVVHDLVGLGLYVDGFDKNLSNVQVYSNTVYNCASGISIAVESVGSVTGVKVYNNVIRDCRPSVGIRFAGYLVNGPMVDVEVYQNTIVRCGNTTASAWENCGILVEADNPLNSNFVIRNNIISQNTRAIRTKNQSYLTIDRNLLDGPLQGGVEGTNAIKTSPQFIDAANHDFHLLSTSPAIEAAVGPHLAPQDRDDTARPQPGPGNQSVLPDLGAFEWVAPQPTTTTLASTANPSPVNGTVTFTATVTHPIGGTQTGTVTFYDGATALGTNALDASGATTLTTSVLGAGSHSITATHNPDSGAVVGGTSSILIQTVTPGPQAAWVRAYFTDGTGTGLPHQYTGSAGEGWLGGWTSVVGTAGVQSATPLLSGGKSLSATRTSGSTASSQAGVWRQWDNTIRPNTSFSRLTFDFRFDSDATFNNAGDAYTIALSNVSGTLPGGNSTVYLRCFGASPGNDFNGNPIRAREWCVFNRIPTADSSYAVNKFIRTGLIAVPGTAYRFTIDIHAAAAAGTTNGKTHGTYDVTITDGVTNHTVSGAGFRSTLYSSGNYLSFASQQNLTTDNLTFSVDSIDLAPLEIPPAANATTTTLTSSANPATFGYSVTFTATVTSSSGTPAGSVSFFDGAVNLGSAVLDANGVATFTTTGLSTGTRVITAAYSGNAGHAASSSPTVSQTVNLSADTVGYWRFESSPGLLEDSSGHGLTLATQGSGPTLLPLPETGPAALFPRIIPQTIAGNSSAATLGTGNFTLTDRPDLQLSNFTIETYLNLVTATSGTQYIASQFDFTSGTQRSWAFGVAGSTPPAGLVAGELFLNLSVNGTSAVIVGSGFIITPGTDYYAAASISASDPTSGIVFYLKNLTGGGELLNSTRANPVGTVFNATTDFQIGSFNNGGGRWQGVLDEVRLSRTALDFYQLLVSLSGPLPVAKPVITPPAGSYFDAVNVTITSATPAANIHYTVNGSTPSAASALYTGPFTITGSATVQAIALKADMPDSAVTTAAFSIPNLTLLGTVKPPHARNITNSNWSVGGETVDRDYTVFANYKDWLGPLGIKRIRQQAGWFKCEKVVGVYDWAWLDECVDGAIEQGLQPWLETNYGNPIYPGGGGSGLGAGLPTSATALTAWDNWVTALVDRYKDRVYEWEVWNEPDNSGGQVTPEAYAAFYIRTAEIIRARQPESRLYALAVTGPSNGPTSYVGRFFAALQAANKLGLVTAVTAHAYPWNPDTSQAGFINMRDWINTNYYPGGGIEVRQGESGAPSQFQTGFALANLNWSELTQAKWNMRRLLGDLGHDIPSSIFAIIDMKYYGTTWNYKGLLKADEDLDVDYPKQSYFGVRNIASIFDDSLTRITGFSHTANTTSALRVFGYQKSGTGKTVASIWFSGGGQPVDSISFTPVNFTLAPADITDPVWVDMRDGSVRSIPATEWSRTGNTCTFTNVPVYDSPILIADRSAIPLASPMDAWKNIHFTVPQQGNESIGGDLADPDRDNSVNLLEYALGSNPTQNSSTARPVSAMDPGGQLTLSFERTADPSLLYQVLGSGDLDEWEEVWSSTGLENLPGSVIAADNAELPQDRRFLRLRVIKSSP